MKNWAVESNGKIWIPSIITLPIGMLYPINKKVLDGVGEVGDGIKKELKWAFAPMVEIPEDKRKDFPNPSIPGKFYDKKIDTDNAVVYDLFIEGMSYINNLLKQKDSSGE
jgi:hypothetical protein